MQWMEERSGCRVEQVVFPYTCRKDYYVSEHGHFYSVCYERWKNKRWCVLPIVGKEKNSGYCYTMWQNGKPIESKVERIVYCTFVLGEWNDEVELEFKDGDPKNICLENIVECGEYLTEESAQRMAEYAGIYQKYFDHVVKRVVWHTEIDWEDAEDLTSKSFVYLCAKERRKKMDDFVALWVYYAKKRAQSFWLWRCAPRIGKLDEMEWLMKRNDTPFGLNILDVLPDERWKISLRMMAEGSSREEVAEVLGLSVRSVSNFLREAKSYLRKYLSTDREIMKMYK